MMKEGHTGAPIRHFLDLDRFEPAFLRWLITCARELKAERRATKPVAALAVRRPRTPPLAGRTLALIFEQPSTRTRVSFEVGARQLGGDVVVLNAGEMQLGRGETIGDTARVLSRYVDAIMLRTDRAAKLNQLADNATVPIINGLTDTSHPCQVMADIMTFEEHRGPIAGRTVAWCGDVNNVAQSWIHAAIRFGFTLRLCHPASLGPPPGLIAWAAEQTGQAEGDGGGRIVSCADPAAAVAGADCVVTDTWVSMNHENAAERRTLLGPFQVNEGLMADAAADALFMHCLPAHRGEEVTDGVLDGRHSVVWDEAENRLHIQKAILLWCLGVLSPPCDQAGRGAGAGRRTAGRQSRDRDRDRSRDRKINVV